MRRIYLVLLLTFPILIDSCKKSHDNPTPIGTGTGTAPVILPVITTTPISAITDSTAVSGGSFTTDGDLTITTRGVQWDTGAGFLNHWTASAGSGISAFQATMTGLMPSTKYYVRAFAGTDTSTYYGNTLSFTTSYKPGKYFVSTLAGTGAQGLTNGDTSVATFSLPFGAAVDAAGNIFIADSKNNAIREITPSGMVSTFASLGAQPNDVITDTAGNVYVAETDYKIIKITPSGQASVFAGSGHPGSSDGTGAAASFYLPVTLAIDPAGNIYVGDIAHFRKITPAGVVSTLANYLTAANSSRTIAADRNFNLYETDGTTVIKVDTLGNKTVLAASGFGYVSEIRLDAANNLYLPDVSANKIWMITPAGVSSVIAGTGAAGAQDGNSAIATFNGPTGLAIDNSGNIIVTDASNNKIRKVTLH